MANKIHFNPFIFSLHLLWTLSHLSSSFLDSFNHTDILTIFDLLGGLRYFNNTFVRVQQANHDSHPHPHPVCLNGHPLCTHAHWFKVEPLVPQRANQVTVPLMATHITVPVKKWLCPSMINIMTTIHDA